MTYKRSQVEDAICRANLVGSPARTKLLTRIKRLFDIDRELLPKRGTDRKQRYAFFSEKGPGAGNETSFQEYEVFAVSVALLMAAQGVPQIDIIEILRSLRPNLEAEHKRILAKPLDQPPEILRAIREGRIDMSMRDPVFLCVTQAIDRPVSFVTKSGLTGNLVRSNEDLWNLFVSNNRRAITALELSLLPHTLHWQLTNIEPRRKGRPWPKKAPARS